MRLFSIYIFAFVEMAVAFSAQSAVHWLPPEKREWERSSLPEHTKRLWEFEWSKSSYNYECSDYRLQIVPIYFWPGERLDIPCKMCELALALNGKVKYWAVAEDVTTFLENPQSNVVNNKNLFTILKNPRILEDPSEGTQERGETTKDYKLPQSFGQYNQDKKYIHIFKEKPVYLERDGKLSILRAGPASQGVYFCFDESSLGSTNLFFVVMAMTPPYSLYDADMYPPLDAHRIKAHIDDCGHTDFIQPSSNWRFHYQPAFRRTRPEYCDATNEGPCNAQNYLEVYAANYTGVYQEKCSLDYCRSRIEKTVIDDTIYDFRLAIELRWDEWSSCTGNVPTQRREAHCYIVEDSFGPPAEAPIEEHLWLDEVKWMGKIGKLVRTDTFKKRGIRLHSSLVASLLYRQHRMQGCEPEEKHLHVAFSDAWRNVLLRALGIRNKDGGPIDRKSNAYFTLQNPFQACMRYNSTGRNHEVIVGTYMTETRACE